MYNPIESCDNSKKGDLNGGKFNFGPYGKTKPTALSPEFLATFGHTVSFFTCHSILPSLSSFVLGRTYAPYSAHQYELGKRRARKLKRSLALTLALSVLAAPCQAKEPDFNRLADSIYKAEGGAKTSHPYGILQKYKHTTPRQACLNTIKHKYASWVQSGRKTPYLAYLGASYAPINAANDPTGLNRNWVKNVTAIYGEAL